MGTNPVTLLASCVIVTLRCPSTALGLLTLFCNELVLYMYFSYLPLSELVDQLAAATVEEAHSCYMDGPGSAGAHSVASQLSAMFLALGVLLAVQAA